MKNNPHYLRNNALINKLNFGIQNVFPKFIINIVLMIKYKCLIALDAVIFFPGNISIGKGTIIRKATIIAQNKIVIGMNCVIENQVIINSKTGEIRIGDYTGINEQCIIHGNGGVFIGKNVAIAPGVKIVKNHLIPPTTPTGDFTYLESKPTTLGDSCWICANTVIVDGVTIGACSIVGANSFVNIDLPDCVVAAGTPVKIIKKRV